MERGRFRRRVRSGKERLSHGALKAGVATGGLLWLNHEIQKSVWEQTGVIGVGIAIGAYLSRKVGRPDNDILNWAQSPWVSIPVKSLLAVGAGLNAARGGPEIMTLFLSGAAGGSLAEPVTRAEEREKIVFKRSPRVQAEVPELYEGLNEGPKVS